MSVTGENIPCSFVDADLTVRIDSLPGVISARFTVIAVTTCPGGLKTGSPEMTFIINGDSFGPYAGALPASVALTGGGIVNISGTFLEPIFSPVDDGLYYIEMTIRAEDECGNADLVTKRVNFEKRPPNPVARLGSSQSGGYVEGDFAEMVTVNDWKIEGSVKDYTGAALAPGAGYEIRLRFFNRETGADLPGSVRFDYSADVDLSSALPLGGTAFLTYIPDLRPYLTGGTGLYSDGATPNSGEFTLHFDKKLWATANGYDYEEAKEVGVTLEVLALGYWSNVGESFFKVYFDDIEVFQIIPSSTVFVNFSDPPPTVGVDYDIVNDTFNGAGAKFTKPDPIRMQIGGNVETFAAGSSVTISPANPSGVGLVEVEFIDDVSTEYGHRAEFIDTTDRAYIKTINVNPVHTASGASGLVFFKHGVEIYQSISPTAGAILRNFTFISGWDPETGVSSFGWGLDSAINGTYLTISGYTSFMLFNGSAVDIDPLAASGSFDVFCSHKTAIHTLQIFTNFITDRGNYVAAYGIVFKVYAY